MKFSASTLYILLFGKKNTKSGVWIWFTYNFSPFLRAKCQNSEMSLSEFPCFIVYAARDIRSIPDTMWRYYRLSNAFNWHTARETTTGCAQFNMTAPSGRGRRKHMNDKLTSGLLLSYM